MKERNAIFSTRPWSSTGNMISYLMPDMLIYEVGGGLRKDNFQRVSIDVAIATAPSTCVRPWLGKGFDLGPSTNGRDNFG